MEGVVGLPLHPIRWSLTPAMFTSMFRPRDELTWITGAFASSVRRPGSKTYHPPTSSAEVKNEWGCTSSPTYAFMAYTRTSLTSGVTKLANVKQYISKGHLQRTQGHL
jgi:hypothetical protein